MCKPEEIKDVDLREKRLSEEVPDHRPSESSEALSTENGWGAITDKEQRQNLGPNEACVDLQEARISVHYKESSGNLNTGKNPAFPHNPSQVSGLDELEAVFSVENDNEGSFKFSDAGGRSDVKDVRVTAQSVLESKPVRQEEKNQPKEIIKATTSSDVVRRGWIVGLCLCCAFHMVDGAGDTHLRTVFHNDIELYGQVPLFSRSTWLHGSRTIQKNGLKNSNMSNETLRINGQGIGNYDLEIRLPDHSYRLQQFPVKALLACVMAENEDLDAFKKGKKVGEVELHGTANVTKHYLFMMQSQTLQIYIEQGTEHRLQPDDVQCKVTFKDIDPGESVKSPDNAAATVEKDGEEKSSDDGKYVVTGVVFGAGIAIVVIGLVLCLYMKKRRRSRTARILDLEAAAGLAENQNEMRISCI